MSSISGMDNYNDRSCLNATNKSCLMDKMITEKVSEAFRVSLTTTGRQYCNTGTSRLNFLFASKSSTSIIQQNKKTISFIEYIPNWCVSTGTRRKTIPTTSNFLNGTANTKWVICIYISANILKLIHVPLVDIYNGHCRMWYSDHSCTLLFF